MKVLLKTVVKHAHQNQAVNIEIVSDQYIKGGKRLIYGEGDFTQKILSSID